MLLCHALRCQALLCVGLYPNLAIGDAHNAERPPLEQAFHIA